MKWSLVLASNSVKKSVNYHSFRVYLLSKRTYQLGLGLGVKPISGPKTSALSKFNPEVGVAHLLRIKTKDKSEKEKRIEELKIGG